MLSALCMGMRHAGGPCLEVLDEAAGALAKGAVVDDVAARFEQQQIVKRLQQEVYRMFSLVTHTLLQNCSLTEC